MKWTRRFHCTLIYKINLFSAFLMGFHFPNLNSCSMSFQNNVFRQGVKYLHSPHSQYWQPLKILILPISHQPFLMKLLSVFFRKKDILFLSQELLQYCVSSLSFRGKYIYYYYYVCNFPENKMFIIAWKIRK